MGRNFRSLIFIAVLFLLSLSGCGMPRMFVWDRNEEYRISSSQLEFNLSYTYYDRDLGSDRTVQLTPLSGTPVMHFYYCITSASGLESNDIASAFRSSYSSKYVPSRDINSTEPIASDSVTITTSNDETTTIRLYEFVNASTGARPVFPNNIDMYLEADESIGSSYLKHATYSAEMVSTGSSGENYIHLTINPDTEKEVEYSLLRFNGDAFQNGISNYIGRNDNGDTREFPDEDDPASNFMDPRVYIYVTCTYLFEGYTTVSTIELQEVTNFSI